jgi:hypothetical protein
MILAYPIHYILYCCGILSFPLYLHQIAGIFIKYMYIIQCLYACSHHEYSWTSSWHIAFLTLTHYCISLLSWHARRECGRSWIRSGHSKDSKIGMCCFSAKHAALSRESKDLLPRNQNNVSEWSDMFIRGLLFQLASTITIQLSVLVQNKVDFIIISLKLTCSCHDIVEKLLNWR